MIPSKQILKELCINQQLILNIDVEGEQIQLAGIDLTLQSVSTFTSTGVVTEERHLPNTSEVSLISDRWILSRGVYLIEYGEVVNIPLDHIALVFPRSSLLRCGVSMQTAVWDPGYSGRGKAILEVLNPLGFITSKGTRISQMIFLQLKQASEEAYSGIYQGLK